MKFRTQMILLFSSSFLFASEPMSYFEMLNPSSHVEADKESNQTENISSNNSLDNEVKKSENNIFNSFEDALKIAKEEDKIILLEMVSTNCPFCKDMEENVLSQENVQEAIKKDFVLAKINVDYDPIPLNLSQQMTPMFVFATADENVEDMRLGYIEEADFLKLLEEQKAKIK